MDNNAPPLLTFPFLYTGETDKKNPDGFRRDFFRAEDEAQTRDPQLGRLMLYQLSYFRRVVGEDGFEPPKTYVSRFTVCPIWPLWYSPVPNADAKIYIFFFFANKFATFSTLKSFGTPYRTHRPDIPGTTAARRKFIAEELPK